MISPEARGARRTALVALLMACMVGVSLASGCTAPVALTAEDDGATVDIGVGQRFEVTLEANPSTGYTWVVAITAPDVVTQLGEARFASADDSMVGAPGEMTFVFEGAKPGSAELDFEYRRPWESNAKAERTFKAGVNVR